MVSLLVSSRDTNKLNQSDMTIVALDGIPTNATTAKAVTIAAGQRYLFFSLISSVKLRLIRRYDVLIKGKSNPTKNYAITSFMPAAGIRASGVLRYNSQSSSRTPNTGPNSLSAAVPIDDFVIAPLDGQPLFAPVDQSITMQVNYGGKAGRRIYLGNNTYVTPKVPTLYTALTTGSAAWNPEVYGTGANAYIIKSGQVVQIIVENHDSIEHPMHLHGYDFQVVARGPGSWDGDESKLPAVPLRRDTVITPPAGHLVIRIKTQNPGTWMFHCHMEFHGK